jgi:hypothetical protein
MNHKSLLGCVLAIAIAIHPRQGFAVAHQRRLDQVEPKSTTALLIVGPNPTVISAVPVEKDCEGEDNLRGTPLAPNDDYWNSSR